MPSPTRFITAARAKRAVAFAAAVCAGSLAAGVGPALAAFPGANGKIAYEHYVPAVDDTDIWTMSPNGRHQVNLTNDPSAPQWSPKWSADGRRIVFTQQPGHRGGSGPWGPRDLRDGRRRLA